MTEEAGIILGISPSTYRMGIALYSYGTLIDRKLRNYTGTLSEAKVYYILNTIEKTVERHNVVHIAIKMTYSPTTEAVQKLTAGIREIAHKRKIGLHEYALEEMERFCSKEKRVNKKVLMDYLIDKYPELRKEYERAVKWNNHPFQKVFEAVGAIELCLHDLRDI